MDVDVRPHVVGYHSLPKFVPRPNMIGYYLLTQFRPVDMDVRPHVVGYHSLPKLVPRVRTWLGMTCSPSSLFYPRCRFRAAGPLAAGGGETAEPCYEEPGRGC